MTDPFLRCRGDDGRVWSLYEMPARERTVLTQRGFERMRRVSTPRMVLAQVLDTRRHDRDRVSLFLRRLEADGRPASHMTVTANAGPIGNLFSDYVCMGSTSAELVERDPVAAFWMSRFSEFPYSLTRKFGRRHDEAVRDWVSRLHTDSA